MHFVQHDQSLLLPAFLREWPSQRSQHAHHDQSIMLSMQNVSSYPPLHHLNLIYTGLGIRILDWWGIFQDRSYNRRICNRFSILENLSAISVLKMWSYHLFHEKSDVKVMPRYLMQSTCCNLWLETAILGSQMPGSRTVFQSRNPGIVWDQSQDFGIEISHNFICWKAHFTTKIQAVNAVVAELARLKAALIPIESLYSGVSW